MSSLEDMRRRLADAERLYLIYTDFERYDPRFTAKADFLERKIAALRRNIAAKARREAVLRSRIMGEPLMRSNIGEFMFGKKRK